MFSPIRPSRRVLTPSDYALDLDAQHGVRCPRGRKPKMDLSCGLVRGCCCAPCSATCSFCNGCSADVACPVETNGCNCTPCAIEAVISGITEGCCGGPDDCALARVGQNIIDQINTTILLQHNSGCGWIGTKSLNGPLFLECGGMGGNDGCVSVTLIATLTRNSSNWTWRYNVKCNDTGASVDFFGTCSSGSCFPPMTLALFSFSLGSGSLCEPPAGPHSQTLSVCCGSAGGAENYGSFQHSGSVTLSVPSNCGVCT